jgi:hypothetical protein
MRIFLSYPRKDTVKAKRLRDTLARGGHNVWMDDQLVTGQPWRDQLEAEIKRADAIALALTPHWLASPYCQWEFITAVENGKKVIPVLLEAVDPIPQRISQYQYADLTKGFSQAAIQKLLNDLVTLAVTVDPAVIRDMNKEIYARQITINLTITGDGNIVGNGNVVTRTGDITTGNVTAGNVVIGGTQVVHGDMTINMEALAGDDDHLRELADLIAQFEAALAALPPGDAEVIQALAQDAINEAGKDQPSKRMLEIRGDALKKAAENLTVVAPIAVRIAQKLLLLG